MTDWLRSLVVLCTAFAAVVATTLGLALAIVPGTTISSEDAAGDAETAASDRARADEAPTGGIPGLGGTLTVTGDREGTFRLNRQAMLDRFGLEGDDGRIIFDGRPAEVVQASYDGLEFFPDPGECTVTPGNLDNAIGIGFAELVCEELVDVRGNGVIGLTGTIGLPVDLLVDRQLPPSGGSIAVGDETWQFDDSELAAFEMGRIAGTTPTYNLVLFDADLLASIGFTYDVMSHELTLAVVQRGDGETHVPEGACELERREIGRLNPRTMVIELTITCPQVDVPGLGPVEISGTVVVDELQWPE